MEDKVGDRAACAFVRPPNLAHGQLTSLDSCASTCSADTTPAHRVGPDALEHGRVGQEVGDDDEADLGLARVEGRFGVRVEMQEEGRDRGETKESRATTRRRGQRGGRGELTMLPRMYTCSSWDTRPSRAVTVISRIAIFRQSSAVA